MGSQLSFSDLERLWVVNGGDPTWAPVAAGVALAESGGNTTSANTSDPAGGSYGLWQINGVHSSTGTANGTFINQMYDPNANAQMAVQLSNNGRNWGPWQGDPVAAAQLQQPGTPLGAGRIVSILGGSGRSTGGAGSGGGPGAAAQDKRAGTPAPGDCDSAKYLINVSPYHFISECQARAMFGAMLVGAGALGMALAVAVLMKSLGVSAPANALEAAPGPIGLAARAASGGKGSSSRKPPQRRQAAPAARSGPAPSSGADAYEEGRRAGMASNREQMDEQERREGFGRYDQPRRPAQRRTSSGTHRRPPRARERPRQPAA